MNWRILMIFAVACILCVMLSACVDKAYKVPAVRTVEVSSPVLEIRPVPDALKRQPVSDADLPLWVAPSNKAATSCLTAEGEAKKRMLDTDFVGKLDAWEKWGVVK